MVQAIPKGLEPYSVWGYKSPSAHKQKSPV